MGRILSIDPGTKRVGLALSDPLKILSSPLQFLPYINQETLIDDICRIVKEKNVETVVIGFPVREDGEEGEGCEYARQVLHALQKRDINAVLWDERYSSKIAQNFLHETGINTRNSKGKIDSAAASVLLENYLAYIKNKENH